MFVFNIVIQGDMLNSQLEYTCVTVTGPLIWNVQTTVNRDSARHGTVDHQGSTELYLCSCIFTVVTLSIKEYTPTNVVLSWEI